MTHLFKLELKKFRLVQKMIISAIAVVFSILFITVSLIDSMADPTQAKDTYDSTFLLIGLLMSFIFLVYSSVLTSSFIISEYNQRTITILFSYPLNKKHLIAVKMILIVVFISISMFVGYICCCGYIIGMDAAFDMLEGSFQMTYLSEWIPAAVISIVVCSILFWWPFVIGMIKKSVPATIITSLIALLLRQLIITNNGAYHSESFSDILIIFVLTLAAVGIVFRKKVAEID